MKKFPWKMTAIFAAAAYVGIIDIPFNSKNADGGFLGLHAHNLGRERVSYFDINGEHVADREFKEIPIYIRKSPYLSHYVSGIYQGREEQRQRCIEAPGKNSLFPYEVAGKPCPWQTANDIYTRGDLVRSRNP